MNYTKSKLVLFSLAIVSLIGCDKKDVNNPSLPEADNLINLTAQEYASIAFDRPKEISEIDAIKIAEDFVKSKESLKVTTPGTKSLSNPSFKVSKKYYVNKKNIDEIRTKSSNNTGTDVNVPLFELSIQNGNEKGLILVSADERAQKVIAYIPKTDQKTGKLPAEAEYMKSLAKLNLVDNIETINHLRDSLKIPTLNKIAKKLGVETKDVEFTKIKDQLSVNSEPLSKFKPVQTPPSQVLSYVLPMVKVKWDQDSPYNKNYPIGMVEKFFPGNFEQGNYPAGCAVIALAQIMSFIQPSITAYGTSMNWAYLTQKESIVEPNIFDPGDPADKREMVAKLMKDIYDKTSSFPQLNSNGYVTGVATYDNKAEEYIKIYANCLNRQTWNSDIVRNSVLALKPVLVTGVGTKEEGGESAHAFVIDGYLLCKLYYGAMSATVPTGTKELVKLYDLYFHANFGWHGAGDGYYLINKDTSVDFEAGGNHYKSGNMKIVANIVKK